MRVLITGADGQVGRALVRSAPDSAHLLPTTRAELDIGDAEAVNTFFRESRPHVVINTAAYTSVDRAESEPELAYRANAAGARHIAGSASLHKARMLQISTDFVFDGRLSSPYSPDAHAQPLGVYGRTKREGELAVLSELPMTAIVLRTSWIYSESGHNFVRTMLRLMRERQSIEVVDDQIGTPTSAASLASAIWEFLAHPDVHGVFHWSDSGVASWYDFAVAIAEESLATGLLRSAPQIIPIATEAYPTPARRPRFSVLDKKSTVETIGLRPQHWRTNLRQVLREIELG